MTSVAQTPPAALAPVTADSFGVLGDLWKVGSMSDPALDDGASDTERIIAAAGAVESLEWELDRANSALAVAVERAATRGCSVEKIAQSAGMTKEDITTILWAERSHL